MILSSSSTKINEEEIKVVSNGTGDNLEFVINEVFALILSHSLSYFSDILSSVFPTAILVSSSLSHFCLLCELSRIHS